MKKVGLIICVTIALVCLLTMNRKPTMVISDNYNHSEEDINQAMKSVNSYFNNHFKGCTLMELKYNQDSHKLEENENTIIILSDFKTKAQCDPSLNPNETYDDYTWILEKENNIWTIKDYGYA